MSAKTSRNTIDYLDRPPAGWFALDVMKEQQRGQGWVALMIDVHPDEYPPDGSRSVRQAWLRVPGKHRNRDAALAALENMIATRH